MSRCEVKKQTAVILRPGRVALIKIFETFPTIFKNESIDKNLQILLNKFVNYAILEEKNVKNVKESIKF